MTEETPSGNGPRNTRRVRLTIYMAGFFGLTIVPMSTVAVPLWALQIGAAPLLIGLALGARAALSIPFSIHGGALMDRLGPRRIMIVCGAGVALLMPIYPLLPWIESVIALQLLTGFCQGFAWMGAQTQISIMTRNDPSLVGRFAFVSTMGNVIGPLITGVAWDLFGPVGAFATVGLCGAGIVVAALLLPKDVSVGSAAVDGKSAPITLRDVMPRFRDYADAFRLMTVPAVGFCIAASFFMTGIYGARHSFYTVYLESIGLSGTLIGVLIASGSLSASLAGLSVSRIIRRMPANWLLIAAVAAAAVGIAATPFFVTFESLFAVALFWGIGGGIAFPLTLYLLSRTVDVDQQGMSVGIRTTVNRTAGFLTPVVMGAIVGASDLMTSFLAVGGITLVCLGLLSIWLLRSPSLRGRV